ncbi:LacI family DNA-binding transcriptional regulator [Ruania halotolerans]|uniref:LacI family DNA-binding transcriptional regulator n=1 Tax=Ruania halotolerans TaxID=2897773 RepID=UPI001E5C3F39|nr:LacI family DNA-binding transcriptional regulator [Ruania halotolerans]UFU07850.1 LacI family transcriptional regulator [Ruania halotolerans]
MTTLREVAAAAGVSMATVSRALAGSTIVAAGTRERVRRIAAELDYQPNRAARQLVTGRGQAIGLVVPDLQNAFYASVATGMQRQVRAAGLSAMIADTDEDASRELEVLGQLAMVCDGAVLASSRTSDDDIAEVAGRTRVVLVNRVLEGVAAVVGDNADGMAQAVAHLAALGHTRIGYAGGPAMSWSDARRREGLTEAARHELAAGAVVDLGAFRPGSAGGIAAADRALAAGVTAILAFNDQLALGILGRLADRSVSVPQQMSVVGFDDVPVARLLAPPLTTVAVPALEMGATAVDLLLTPGEAATRVLPVELQVRRSTAEPPG